MALKSTVFKANVQLADIDHGHYADHALTMARHPSETDERMMVRLVALALNAHELQAMCAGDGTLAFGGGLSTPDEPDLSLVDFSGRKRLWVEVGQPDEKPLQKACSQADQVRVYAYGSSAELWWRGLERKVERMERLQVWRLPAEQAQALAGLAERSMQLQATLMDGVLTLSGERGSVAVEPARWR